MTVIILFQELRILKLNYGNLKIINKKFMNHIVR